MIQELQLLVPIGGAADMVQQVAVSVDDYLGSDQAQGLEDVVVTLAEVLLWVGRGVQVRKASDSLRTSC